ncbi:hypothetical protein [Acidithiobacillus sp.]|uniref:restriction endonuclease n=1 Tax=Acidithiobacillus sp. TaxID=1872118 RepID=UPI00345BF991
MSQQNMTIYDVLEQYRSLSRDQLHKGKLFERMIAQFLMTDPQYANKLQEVWMWADWPGRWQAENAGIDLIAETLEGEYWAIQCKFYDAVTPSRKNISLLFWQMQARSFW